MVFMHAPSSVVSYRKRGLYAKRERVGSKRQRQQFMPLYRNIRTAGFMGKELKFIDQEYDAAVSAGLPGSEADPATVLCLNATAQGDGNSDRDGRRQYTNSIWVNGNVEFTALDTTAIGSTYYVKLSLVLDTQTNGAQFAATSVYDEPTNSDIDVDAFRNLEYTHRFKVLKTVIVKQVVGAAVWDGDSIHKIGCKVPFRIRYKFKKPLITTYTGTSAVVGNIADNSLHLIATQVQAAGGSHATLRYVSRCRFTSG